MIDGATIEYRNPAYADTTGNAIQCEIDDPEYGWSFFVATANDVTPYGPVLYERIKADGGIGPFEPTPQPKRAPPREVILSAEIEELKTRLAKLEGTMKK